MTTLDYDFIGSKRIGMFGGELRLNPRLAKPLPLQEGVVGSAVFSPCKRYRYVLSRVWNEVERPRMVAFIGLNPSCASANEDDRTVRKCQSLARRWGFDGMYMLNVYPYRATDPKEMQVHYLTLPALEALALKLENLNAILQYGRASEMAIACWGAHGESQDAEAIRGELALSHLGLTKRNQPKHPLYLPHNVELTYWI